MPAISVHLILNKDLRNVCHSKDVGTSPTRLLPLTHSEDILNDVIRLLFLCLHKMKPNLVYHRSYYGISLASWNRPDHYL